ncbi:MAG: coniferyl aldehyde dehydrogenase [Gammaproteobacteria bacterium]|jgi:coniferyl-aldehyde dehydrogenase|nr:coniferyl aldehyde dehydrogenase [Gammaproteobacteria bacterium]MBK6584311.1 coniferyl aldehyde dehydrogenase [Gammaproteobacteria bacterium]MBK7168445.1 coniferyl aldehyde dehydrogenase [Gammaproteobacteria bacterium]MBK7520772.1 coniferyl aldehyde dehydrogenase [Gammaproteobacteria bacterium]MBK7727983.1 coniferyl aldehyde dehydrogenase [Gammaproteobacteria bacterium]
MLIVEETRLQQIASTMQKTLELQKSAFLADGVADYKTRIDRLDRLRSLLGENRHLLCEALSLDFGHRSIDHAQLTEIAAPVAGLEYTKRHLRKWMKAEQRKIPLLFSLLGARATVRYQPLGSVGVIVPWNFPVYLTMGPLTGIIAAGNRAMVKPSEFTPRVSDLLCELFGKYFDKSEIAVFPGGADVSAAFSELPFDHLLFTGAGSIARHVMRAASANLVPVTLELGGKSPTIISRDADLEKAAISIMDFKLSNAGQICIAPDYLLVPEEKLNEVVSVMEQTVRRLFPTLIDNPDYTSIVNERHFQRLQSYVDDALAAGVEMVEINPAGDDFSNQPYFKMPPRLFLNPGDDRLIMQNEIFGPLLPIKTYKQVEEAIDYINRHDRPLALYYFGLADGAEVEQVISRTLSGGVAINDVAAQAGCESLPFGGIGPSGMGVYHGFDGFKSFSHGRGIYKQSRINLSDLFGLRPPYGPKFRKAIKNMMK